MVAAKHMFRPEIETTTVLNNITQSDESLFIVEKGHSCALLCPKNENVLKLEKDLGS